MLDELARPSYTAGYEWARSNGHTGCDLRTRANGPRRASDAVPDHMLGSNVMIKALIGVIGL